MITKNHPNIDLSSLYISGLQIKFDEDFSPTDGFISAGECRDDTNSFNMSTPGIIFNPSIVGINGLDSFTRPSAPDGVLYSIYLIGDSSGSNLTACILTPTVNPNPWMPAGYDIKRLIGYLLSFGVGQFQDCFITGSSNYRKFIISGLPTDYTVLSTATAYTFIDLTYYLPPVVNTPVLLFLSYLPGTAGNITQVQEDNYIGQSATARYTNNITAYATLNGSNVLGISAGSAAPGDNTTIGFLGFDFCV